MSDKYFVATSNVDGQFHKAGFAPERIYECHGSIHWLQCADRCSERVWSADSLEPIINESLCLWTSDLPKCPDCGGPARPSIQMFDDNLWIGGRSGIQHTQCFSWLENSKRRVVMEIGAGTNIPTIRNIGEYSEYPLIRINPDDKNSCSRNKVVIRGNGLEVIRHISDVLWNYPPPRE